ncbi:MAG: CoA-disulfide reductase [Bacillota bacterium]|jgi:CoA-disulfide reductase
MSKILIVGGVAGGASAAARLRRLDEKAQIVLFERGEFISFANCGLPYHISDTIPDKDSLILELPEDFNKRFNVDVRIFSEVTAINRQNKTVAVKNHQTGETYGESYDKIILSPGARTFYPNVEGLDNDKVFTLRNIPDTYRIKDYIQQKKPRSVIVVGGGYIGMEMAENLHDAGLDVTIVEFADHVIGSLDYDMACDVHNHIRQKGVKLILNDGVQAISESSDGLVVKLGLSELLTDMVVLAVGVTPESSLAQEAGLKVNARGAIIVDEYMRTSDENIFAVGDVVEITNFVTGEQGYIPLAGPANKQGRIAADNICGLNSTYRGTQGTSILKCFDLTIATTGINEDKAKKLSLNYEKPFSYSPSHASYYPGSVNMSLKIIFDKENGKLLGAQIVGFGGVDKRIDVLATAIRAGMTVYDLTRLELAYAPPYSSAKDPINMAGFNAENFLTGKVKIFHWHDVQNLPRDGSVTLLDVRTDLEFAEGSIEGFINIAVDDLRDNLHKLDKTKPVYVICQIAVRGYIACRILSGNGFDCYNLSGGYRLYDGIFGDYTKEQGVIDIEKESMFPTQSLKDTAIASATIKINACGLQCPGPIMKLSEAIKNAADGDVIEIKTNDPAFAADAEAWSRRTGNTFMGVHSEKGLYTAMIKKGGVLYSNTSSEGHKKNIIVFSGDLDKAIASFIIANAAAAMGRKVSMFFTFWGLNILRKPEKIPVKKDFMSGMFSSMMPRGSKKLALSKMNMGGMGAKMIRKVMKDKNVDSLESLIEASIKNGVELVACTMSMDVMGLSMEELIYGVKPGGAAAMLAHAEESDMSLFI